MLELLHRSPQTRIAAVMLPLAIACSDGPAAPKPGDAAGTFKATLSGALSQTATGIAKLAVSPNGYAVDLTPPGGPYGFSLGVVADGERPSVGTYPITPITYPQPSPTAGARACLDNTKACFVNWGAYWETAVGAGRLEITQSAPAGITGNLEVDLRADTAQVDGSGPVLHVSARFNATCWREAAC